MTRPSDDHDEAEGGVVESFGRRLRDIGDALPIGDDDLGLAGVRRAVHQRRRRTRLLPVAAAAAIGVAAITVGALSSRSTDTLSVSSPTSDVAAPDIATAPATSPSTTTLVTTTATGQDDGGALPPATRPDPGGSSVRTEAVDFSVVDVVRPPRIDAPATDVDDVIPIPEQLPVPENFPDGTVIETDFDWLVEWQGGFLLGANLYDDPLRFDARFSPDGLTWEQIDVSVPGVQLSVHDVASTGDRLVVLASERVGDRNLAAVYDTTDLATWRRRVLPSADPTVDFEADAPVTVGHSAIELAVNDDAWAAQVRGDVDLNVFRLLADVTGVEDEELGSVGYSDARNGVLDIEWSTRADVEAVQGTDQTPPSETVRVDLSADLGFSDEQIEMLDRGPYNEMWVGDWNADAPMLVGELPPGSFGGVAASDDAVAGWTSTHIGVIANGGDTMRVFSTRPDVAERASISEVFVDGDDFVVHANAPSARATFDRLDHRAAVWTPLDLEPLPPTVRPGFGAGGDIATMSPQALPGAVAEISSIDVDGYRYTNTFDPPFSTYELRLIETDEVVATETVDIRFGADPRSDRWRFRSFDVAEHRVTDPDTGDVLIDLTDEQATQFFESRTRLDGTSAPNPTLADFTPGDDWIASLSAGTWFLHDLPEPGSDENGNRRRSQTGLLERSGDVILVDTADGWRRFVLV